MELFITKKNRFLNLFLFAILATFVTFTACKDYDYEIDDLQEQITSLQSMIDEINESGKVIESVTSTADGVVVRLKDGPSYTIKNGKDGKDGKDGSNGKDGSVVTIGENGNWFIDGEDTGKPSRGAKGEDGVYYIPGDDGFWHKEEGEEVTPTKDSWIIEGTITAKLEDGYVVLYNVEGAEDPIILGLSKINNLVLKPDFVDENHNPVINFSSLKTLDGESSPANALVRYQVSPSNASERFIDKENLYFKYNNPEVVPVSRSADLNLKAEFVSLEKGVLTVRASVDAKKLKELEGDNKITQLMLVVPSTLEMRLCLIGLLFLLCRRLSLVRVPTEESEDINWSEFKLPETLAEAKEVPVTDSSVVELKYRELRSS